jgi:pilin isopeptide linkage protein/LPXTG-motif cell wall-anchored protein
VNQEGEVSVVLQGLKFAEGANFTAGQFRFAILDENGDIVAEGTNDGDGNIIFDPIDLEGVYDGDVFSFTVIELPLVGSLWSTDMTIFRVEIEIEDGPGGSVIAITSYLDGPIEFTNIYLTLEQGVVVFIEATKTVTGTGAELKANQFTFALRDADGTIVFTTTNDADGKIVFPAVLFEEAGEFEFTVTETTPNGNNWRVDTRVFTVKVIVTEEDIQGVIELIADVEYPEGGIIFVNTYDKPNTPKTGDNALLLVALSGLFVAAGVASVVVYWRRKQSSL